MNKFSSMLTYLQSTSINCNEIFVILSKMFPVDIQSKKTTNALYSVFNKNYIIHIVKMRYTHKIKQ